MKFKYQKQLSDSLRIAVVLISLLALVTSGARAAARAFESYQADDASEALKSDAVHLVPGEPDVDDIGDEMAHGVRPNTEQAAILSGPSFFRSANDDDRYAQSLSYDTIDFISELKIRKCSSSVNSLCLVSSSLGRQFTLLGAKPSGTM